MVGSRPENPANTNEVCLIIHPYTAKKDVGAGHDRYAYELIKHLKNQPELNLSFFESGELRSLPAVAWAEMQAISRLFFSAKPRVLHATASANAQCAISAGKKPLVTTVHDVLWFEVGNKYDTSLKYHLKTRAIRRAAQKSDRVIVPFASTRNFLIDKLRVPPANIRLIPYGVDHEAFYPRQAEEQLVHPAVFDRAFKNVLFVGAVNFGKGIDSLIKSFPTVVKAVPEARLIIGSKGWDVPLIKKLYEESPVKDRIVFAGFIPEQDLRSFYIHADVTCFPSRYGFGLPTLESMACGTPTVSGRTLDAPEFIEDAGLMADPNAPDDIAAQLIAALSKTDLRDSLIAKGLKKAKQYSWQKNVEHTANVYRELQS